MTKSFDIPRKSKNWSYGNFPSNRNKDVSDMFVVSEPETAPSRKDTILGTLFLILFVGALGAVCVLLSV